MIIQCIYIYIYILVGSNKRNISFHQKDSFDRIKSFACHYFHIFASPLVTSQLFISHSRQFRWIHIALFSGIQLWPMCEHGIKHEVGLTTCSVPPCTMRYRGLLWDKALGTRGILCSLRLILSSSCNAAEDILFRDFDTNILCGSVPIYLK